MVSAEAGDKENARQGSLAALRLAPQVPRPPRAALGPIAQGAGTSAGTGHMGGVHAHVWMGSQERTSEWIPLLGACVAGEV